jgi:hypothetical protein
MPFHHGRECFAGEMIMQSLDDEKLLPCQVIIRADQSV